MTSNELNKAIHKWLGKHWHEWKTEAAVLSSVCLECGDVLSQSTANPNYCNGYNAVMEFLEVAINEVGEQIIGSYMPDVDGDSYEIDMLRSAMLPIRELAEAGAKAVGIWEE